MPDTASKVQALAAAVTTALNTAAAADAFAAEFTAERKYRVQYQQEDVTSLTVCVVGSKTTYDLATRGGSLNADYRVDVIFAKKPEDPDSVTELDTLALLVEQVGRYFFTSNIAGITERLLAINTDEGGDFDFHETRLRENRVWQGVVSLLFKGFQ